MKQDISFQFETIELLEFSMMTPNKGVESKTQYKLDINIEHRFNIEYNRIFVIVSIDIIDENNDAGLSSFKISCIYKIKNLREFIDDNRVSLPEEMITTLNSISLSTCRGILFSSLKGTFLHNVILPIIDPLSLNQ